MRGNITRRGKNSWRIKFEIEPNANGNRQYRLWGWLEGKHGLSPVSSERYREIIARGIVPMLGSIELQKLKPAHVRDWLSGMVKHGSRSGGPLTTRTVRHSYRVLRAALQDAQT